MRFSISQRWMGALVGMAVGLLSLAALASRAAPAQPPRPAQDARLVVFEMFNVDT